MRNKTLLHIIFLCLLIQPTKAQDWQWWPLGLTHERLSGDTLCYSAEVLGVASSGTYDYRSSGSWIIQMGFGGRHVDWRMYYRAFPSAYLTTMEDGFLGTSLTYYF